MINCRPTHLSFLFRSNHNLIPLLKNPRKALKKEPNKTPQKPRQRPTNDDDVLCNFPKEFYRKTKINARMTHQLYLVNGTTAAKIAQHLTSLPDQNISFVEMNPGPGLLTKLLIHSGMKDLRLFEGRLEFLEHLQETYTNVYPERVKLKHANLIALHRIMHNDQLTAGTRADEILSGLPITEWQNGINFRLFGATGSTTFFKQLIQSIVFENGLLALGRCELYMALPSTTYITLTSSTTSRCTRRGPKATEIDPELMYFIKIVPRRDLHQLCPGNQIQELWHFIKRNCHSRHNRIILLLEKWIPGCGARLLLNFSTQTPVPAQPKHAVTLCETPPNTNRSMTLSHRDYFGNFHIFTQFGDLEPSQLFTLFREFRMLPEYDSCNFFPSLESVLLKTGAKSDVEAHTLKPSDGGSSIDDDLEGKVCKAVKVK